MKQAEDRQHPEENPQGKPFRSPRQNPLSAETSLGILIDFWPRRSPTRSPVRRRPLFRLSVCASPSPRARPSPSGAGASPPPHLSVADH